MNKIMLLPGLILVLILSASFLNLSGQEYCLQQDGKLGVICNSPGMISDDPDVVNKAYERTGGDAKFKYIIKDEIPVLDLFFALGQSNMAGRAPITTSVSDTIHKVQLFDDFNSWLPAVNPMNQYSNIRKDLSLQKVGPSYSFVKTLSAYVDRDIGIVVNARGGTAIAAFSRGEYHDPMFSRLRAAKLFGEVKAIIWHQGESDNSKASAYMADLELLVKDLRAEFGNAYFVAGQMGGWNAEGGTIPKYKAINTIISTIEEHILNASYVTNEGLDHIGDYSHFNLESQILLGQRYAQKVLKNVYGVDISIIDIEITGDGYAVFGEDTIVGNSSCSCTTLKGSDRTIEVHPETGKVITGLVINGQEIKGIEGSGSYFYNLDTFEDSGISIVLASGIPENIEQNNSGKDQSQGIIYPNPATNWFNIKAYLDVKGIEIFSLQGKRLLYSRESENVDISSLAAGSYFVVVSLESRNIFSMLIKT